MIDEVGLCNAASVDWPTVDPPLKETPAKENCTQGDESNAEQEEAHSKDTRLEEEDDANVLEELAVDRIILNVWKGDSIQYVLPFYSCTPADDTVETPTHIPDHFITNYSHWAREQDRRSQQ